MKIETERLVLRPWEETDAEDLFEYAKDPQVGPRAGWPTHTDLETSRSILKNVLMVPETYAVVLKRIGRAIGSIGIHNRPNGLPGEPEIGFWLGVPHWGKGYTPEAVRAIQRHCFEDLGNTGLWCAYFIGNDQSKRVQEKCGFKPHHVKTNEVCATGEYHDVCYNYLSKEEWLANEQK